jgi:hypothetical protein
MNIAKTTSLNSPHSSPEIDGRPVWAWNGKRWLAITLPASVFLLSTWFLYPVIWSRSAPIVNDNILSVQQKLLIQKFGQPENFQIAFDEEETGNESKSSARVETWFYHRNLTSFSFVNGKFCESKRIEGLPERSLNGAYRPDQFRYGEPIENVRKALKLEEKQLAKMSIDDLGLETPLPKGLAMWFAPQLIMGFSDNKLQFVQTISCSEVDEESQK